MHDAAPRPRQAGRHYRALGRNVLLKNLSETSRIFQMAFFVVVARRFGPAGLGDLTVLLMIGSVVGLIFGDLGVNTTMIARMNGAAGAARERIASTGLFWKVVLSALSFVLMIAAMRLGVRFGTWPEIFAVAVISVGSLWHEFLAALTNGVNRLDAEAWLRLIYRAAVYGGGTVACFFSGLGVVLVCMAAAATAVLTVAFLVIHSRAVPLGLVRLGHQTVPGFLKEAAPVWITQVSQLTYLKLDVVILGVLHVAAKEVGWYAAGWKIIDVLTVIPALLAGAALPLISGALPEADASVIAPGYLKAMYVLPFFLVLPLAIGAGWIARLLYGNAFESAAGVLSVLAWALVPFCVHTFLVTLAVAKGRQWEAAKLGGVVAVLGLLAAAAFVPNLGYQAMAVISVVVNALFAFAMVYRFRHVTASMHFLVGFKSLVSALAVFGLSFVCANHVPPVLLTVCGVAAYALALLLSRVVTPSDLSTGWRLAGSLLWNRPVEKVSVA